MAIAPQTASAAPLADEIIVERAPGLTASERADLRADAGVRLERTIGLPRVEVLAARSGDRAEALAELRADPDVVWAEPNLPRTAATTDALFSSLWGLDNTGQFIGGVADADIDAPEAWATTKGAGVTVGVVDSGVLLTHPDLVPAANGGEQGTDGLGADRRTNGVDDDANGKVDDWRGWDWIGLDNDPTDLHGHGTHVSGTVAAIEDTGGVVGVAPQAQTLALRVLNASGSGSTASSAAAFDYAGDLGLRVVNASIGSDGASFAERNAIQAHPQTLYVVAAGNAARDNDVQPTYPCAYPEPNVLCVGATDDADARASFSNAGATSVDLFAPGASIRSSTFDGGWGWMSGTSMASPHVAGAAALLFADDPTLTAAEAKQALMSTVDPLPGLAGLAVTGGRLNAAAALAAPDAPDRTPTRLRRRPSEPHRCRRHRHPSRSTGPTTPRATSPATASTPPTRRRRWPRRRRAPTSAPACPPGTTHGFRVTAVDLAGNESAPTAHAFAATASPITGRSARGRGARRAAARTRRTSWCCPATTRRTRTSPRTRCRPAPPSPPCASPAAPSSSRRRSRARSARLSFTVGAAGPVRVTLSRRVCRKGRCAYVTRGTRTVAVAAGAQRWTVGPKVAGMRLASGRYRLTLSTPDAAARVALRVTRR